MNVLSIYGIFKYQQLKIRREIKRQIKRGAKEEDLHIFNFNKEEYENLNWIKSNEFQLADKFYDVVRYEESKTHFKLYCIDDQQELALFSKLDELVKNRTGSPNGSALLKQLFKVKAYYLHLDIIISARYIDIQQLFKRLNLETSAGFEKQNIKPPTFSTN